jgi:hypothetical protein
MHSMEDWVIILNSRLLRNGVPINHHIFSSIWSSVKQEAPIILENSCWKVGLRISINLWIDHWCGLPLATSLNIHHYVIQWLPSKVSDIIHNQVRHIPPLLDNLYPLLKNIVQKITLLLEPSLDMLVWKGTSNGMLSLKDAYEFKRHHFPILARCKNIWSKYFPPSRSLLVWRVMLDKVPTYDKLSERDCNLPSMCSLCKLHSETLFHLFFECNFAFSI